MDPALGGIMADPPSLPEPTPAPASPPIASPESNASAIRLRARRAAIQASWLERVRQELPALRDKPEDALVDNMPNIVDSLVESLEQSNITAWNRELFTRHADARLGWEDYSPDELMREYAILRKVLFSALETEASLPPNERDVILDFIDEGVQIGSTRFSEVQRFHERLEMQYLKLIEHLIAESAAAGVLEGGLERLLAIIRKDLRAEAAAFFLYGEQTLDVTLSAAAAKSRQLAELYRAALGMSTVTLSNAVRGEAVRLIDLDSLEPAAREGIEQLGVEWLVCVKILARDHLPGTLCLGFHEKRALDPAELHLLEVLGDRLALLLASVQLQEQSRAALERVGREHDLIEVERNRLEEERKNRDQLIAAISHDLKNPLSSAKLGAELIRKGQATPSATERLADQILRSISRSDRMIHDLLDAHRIRAGKPPSLQMVPYRMNDLVNEAVEEMRRLHGDRFVVQARSDVAGFWSWDGMRRVVENLLTNAVKYSTPGSTILVTLEIGAGNKMSLSVHNQGPALSVDEQTRIFLPFERGKSAEQSRQRGWGIGLTLVQGIVDAHGGSITVDSTPDHGTTFMINNPMDSRPYQPQGAQA
jgi:signal transduction histidine kinase